MGLIVEVYRGSFGDFTNGGISGKYNELTIVNVSGPFEPAEDRPAALLVDGPMRTKHVVPAELVDGKWVPIRIEGRTTPMAGGNYAGTSDHRWCDAVGFYGAVSIHDRYETWEQYNQLSQ